MGTNLAVANKETRLAVAAPEFSNEQIRILAETVAKGCDQNELAFFLQVAKLKRLDPFTGQIHVVKRWDSNLGKEKITVQTGIDGFRVIAARTDELAGIDDPEYDTEEGEHPNVAKVTVYRYGRNDEKIAYKATARWSEYAQTKKDGNVNSMWRKLPFLMLGKCAESLALRKAFPDELSGMYTNEEMDQAENEGVTPASVKPQVQMPKSTDEKKPPAAQQGKTEAASQGKAETQSASRDAVKISGEITEAKPGTGKAEGILFLIVETADGKKLVSVPKELATAEMVVKAKILLTATKRSTGKGDQYMTSAVEMVVSPEGEIIDAEFSDVDEGPKEKRPDPVLEEARAAGLGGIFDGDYESAKKAPPAAEASPAPAATGEATKPGTIGVKRAKRLYALITQGHKNTGFTEAECKKIMSALPVPIEHVRDIEMGMYEQFEKWATGEEDFQAFWRD